MSKFNYRFDEKTVKNANKLTLNKKFELALTGAQLIVQDSEGISVTSSYFYGLFKMRILAVDILRMVECELTLTEDQFDELDTLNILGKISAMRSKKDKTYLADKAKAVMADYNDVVAMLDVEIENELRRRNDVIARFSDALNKFDEELKAIITPETIEKIVNAQVETANSENKEKTK